MFLAKLSTSLSRNATDSHILFHPFLRRGLLKIIHNTETDILQSFCIIYMKKVSGEGEHESLFGERCHEPRKDRKLEIEVFPKNLEKSSLLSLLVKLR